jgi:hypothetical protein
MLVRSNKNILGVVFNFSYQYKLYILASLNWTPVATSSVKCVSFLMNISKYCKVAVFKVKFWGSLRIAAFLAR